MSVEHIIGTYSAPIELTPAKQSGTRDVIVDIVRENYATFNQGVDLVCLYSINFSQDRNTKVILYKHDCSVYNVDFDNIDEDFEDVFHTERNEGAYEPVTRRAVVTLDANPMSLPYNVRSRNGGLVGIETVSYTLKGKEGQRNTINVVRYFDPTNPDQPLAETWFAQRERSAATGHL